MDDVYNKILLPDHFYGYFYRDVSYINGSRVVGPDGSGLQFILEELMSYGAGYILISKYAQISKESLEALPILFRDRIIHIDKKKEIDVENKVHKILLPLMSEFDCEIVYGGIARKKATSLESQKEGILFESSNLRIALHQLLLGVALNIQVDINIERTISRIDSLLKITRSRESRATLTILKGLFNSYNKISYDSFDVYLSKSKHHELILNDMINTNTFVEFSMNTKELAKSNSSKEVLSNIRNSSTGLIKNPAYKAVLKYSLKIISALTGIPSPNIEDLEKLFIKSKDLPGIVDLDNNLVRARNQWMSYNPEFIFLKDYEGLNLENQEIENSKFLRIHEFSR